MPLLIAIALFVACSTDVIPPATPGALVLEQYCEVYGVECGKVYEFRFSPAETPSGLTELCVLDEDIIAAEHRYGPARLSQDPRFNEANLCIVCCEGSCGPGCNAYSGCYCEAQ